MEVAQKDCQIILLSASRIHNDINKFDEYSEDFKTKKELFRRHCETILKGNPKLGIKPAKEGSDVEVKVKEVLLNFHQFEKVAEDLLSVKGILVKGIKTAGKNTGAMNARMDDLVQREINQLSESSEKTKTVVDDLLVVVNDQIGQAQKEITAIQTSVFVTFVFFVILAILLAATFGVLTSRYITVRIDKMVHALTKGAEGNLKIRVDIDSWDEIGTLGNNFNTMLEKLSEMMGNVNKSTREISYVNEKLSEASLQVANGAQIQADGISSTSSAITEISASIRGVAQGVDSLSQSATESSSSILEMAASVEEVAHNVETLSLSVDEVSSSITEMAASIREVGISVVTLMDTASNTASSVMEMDGSIKQVEANVVETADISEGVRTDAEMGKKAVEANILGMNEIKRSSMITSEVIKTLSGRADDIGTILSVIDEVAEQTSLLALNAAIIASQAGEHGKGFAVVADEIKELSERTSSSTREIALVIRGVQEETQRAVEAINQAEKSISEGELLSQKSGEALSKIVEGVKKSTNRMSEIARATVEQAKGSMMIRNAMVKVSDMVSQIATSTHEQEKGSELINQAVQKMKDLTAQVRSSTREQSKVGNFIARSTEDITDMIKKIKISCDEQSRGGDQIVLAIEDIQRSTDINLEAINILDNALTSLLKQTEILKKEMTVFKV
jgi:methyl-accepting chemotaxis protein